MHTNICIGSSQDKISQLNKCIQQAIDSQNILTNSQCNKISREIWYLPEREDMQNAIARLLWYISAFQEGKEHLGIMETTVAVELVLPEISHGRLLNRCLEAAVRICEEYESQNQPYE